LKNPGLAAILSFFVPGLGQMYCGDIVFGFVVLFAFVVSLVLWFWLAILVWIFAVWDAYRIAERHNRKLLPPPPPR